jgi:hypothetical protein
MASFFYADIKTDELQVHGHTANNSGQIELYDANSSNIIILKAPTIISQANITLTLPSTVSNTNSIMVNHGGTGELALISPSGDLSMANYGQFTVNGISNTSNITSTANIVLSGNKALYLRDSNNFINSNSLNDMLIKSNSGNIFITANGEVVLLSKSNGTVKIINEGVNELGFIVETPNTYVNFGGTTGTSGYGIRDNNGVLQLKNRPNANTYPVDWSNIVTHLSNCADVSFTNLANNNALFYNSTTGKWVNNPIDGSFGYYGSFYDTTTQTSAGQTSANAMKFNSTAEAHGISIVNNTNITVNYAGVYSIHFTAQLENLGSGTHDVNVWLTKNGSIESNTQTKVTLVSNNAKNIASRNYTLTLNANDYLTLYWSATTGTQIQLSNTTAGTSPTRPAVPSAALSITQVINIQDSTLRMGDLLNVNDTAKTGNSIIQFNSVTNQYEAVSNISLSVNKHLVLGSANIGFDANANVLLEGSNQFITQVNGNHVISLTHINNNSFINMTATSGESGIGIKRTSGGQIQVKPNTTEPWTDMVTHLSNCGDVSFTGLANNNILTYNSATSKWTNKSNIYVAGSGDSNGLSIVLGTGNQAGLYIGWTPGSNMTGRPSCITSSANADIRWAASFNNSKSGTASNSFISFSRNGTSTGSISNDGTTTAYNTVSDYRLKSNVITMTTGLDTVNLLNPITFNWNATGLSGAGFIAHEVQSIIPQAITGVKDSVYPDGTPEYQGIDTSMIVVYLVSAIKNLSDRVVYLENYISNI